MKPSNLRIIIVGVCFFLSTVDIFLYVEIIVLFHKTLPTCTYSKKKILLRTTFGNTHIFNFVYKSMNS